MTAAPHYSVVVHRGRTIYVGVVGVESEYGATPIVCELGDPPHAKTARRIRVEQTLATRTKARRTGSRRRARGSTGASTSSRTIA